MQARPTRAQRHSQRIVLEQVTRLIVSESAKVSPNADIEDSIRGTRIVIESGVVIDSFVKLKPAGGSGDVLIGKNSYMEEYGIYPREAAYQDRREVVERLVDGAILITKQECSQSSAQSQLQAEEGNFAIEQSNR